MSAFDKVIGYTAVKEELLQICDMIRNRAVYTRLGAKLPRGLLLHGAPGMGKTLLAGCFIEESGLAAFPVRRKRSSGMIEEILEAFRKAREQAPAIVLLDDMDKFANEDREHRNAAEYVAVQNAMDELGEAGVFVIATVNDCSRLPDSLRRPGRFDRKIHLKTPGPGDAQKIISHYLEDKPLALDLDMEDLCRMVSYHSCAELQSILNEAAIYAGYRRRDHIGMEDMVRAVLHRQHRFQETGWGEQDSAALRHTALHEAGHLVVCEALCRGSAGLAAVTKRDNSEPEGLVHLCREMPAQDHHILIALAGRTAVEMYYPGMGAAGTEDDYDKAVCKLRKEITETAFLGIGFLDMGSVNSPQPSESLNQRTEAVMQVELERRQHKVRRILLQNQRLLERAAEELETKKVLLYSDIQRLEEECGLQEA